MGCGEGEGVCLLGGWYGGWFKGEELTLLVWKAGVGSKGSGPSAYRECAEEVESMVKMACFQ